MRSAPPAVRVGDTVFDNNLYDSEVDVLYLHVGDPAAAVDWIGTEEGDGSSHAADGSLIGLTILNAKARLDEDGAIALTLPDRKLVVTDLGDVFEHPAPKYVPDLVTIAGRVALGGIEFDDVTYDRKLDVLYLRASSRTAASRDGSEECFPVELDAEGNLVAITVAEARRLLSAEGKIVATLRDRRRYELPDLRDALAAA